VRILQPRPPHCIGSIVRVEGVYPCRLAVIVALTHRGRHYAAVDPEGGFIRGRSDRLHFVCPRRFRTKMAQLLRQHGLPVGQEVPLQPKARRH
jgi:hypothetical protein